MRKISISKKKLFSIFVVLIVPLSQYLDYIKVGTTLVNSIILMLGMASFILILLKRKATGTLYIWCFFLVLNFIYLLLYVGTDPRASGKFNTILLVNVLFYLFYYGGVSGLLGSRQMKYLLALSFIVGVFINIDTLTYFKVEKGREEFVSNAAYYLVYLVPYLYFIRSKIINFLLMVLMGYFVMSSSKRGANILFFVNVFIMFLYLNIASFNLSYKRILKQMLSLTVICVSIIPLIKVFSSKFNYLSERLIALSSEEGGSGRSLMWNNLYTSWLYDDSFFKQMFGFGFSASRDYTGNYLYAHNDWLESLINFGVFGFILYFLFWLLLFYDFMKTNPALQAKYQFITSYILGLLASFFSMFYSGYGSASILVILLGYLLGRQNRKNSGVQSK